MKESVSVRPQERYALRMLELIRHDPQLISLTPDPAVRKATLEGDLSIDRIAEIVLDAYADRPALGDRAYEILPDGDTGKPVRKYLPEFKTMSYAELQLRSKAVAMAWRNHPEFKIKRDDLVCILGFGSTEYMILDIGSVFSQAVSVPMQSATSGADFNDILSNVNPSVLGATVDDIVFAAQHAVKHGNIPTLIVFDYDQRDHTEHARLEEARSILQHANCTTRLIELNELIEAGRAIPWEPLEDHPDGLDRMSLIIHSSGATGVPKGAVAREYVARQFWIPPEDKLPIVTLIFAPLNHGIGRVSVISALAKGGTAYFTLKPDMSTLFEDFRLVRPTYVSFFPRVLELTYQHFQTEVERRCLADDCDEEEIREAVKGEMRSTFLGNRLRAAAMGGAPVSKKVSDFIADCFDILLIEGYGSTEVGIVARDGRLMRPPVIDYKLRDIPELGYFTTDKPYPRGEFCCKSLFAMTEYYKQPEATAALQDEEGFLFTGDIVEERGPDHIVIIDRRKDVLKLSQGEYVAVGPLGTLFEGGSAIIKQIYVYGNPLQSFLLSVVVPDPDVVAAQLGDSASDSDLKACIRDELQAVARRENLKSFEVPRDFIIENEPFSQANGLLSSVRKRLRPALRRKYGERLEVLYDEFERKQREDLSALKDPDSSLSVLEKVGKLLEVNLGVQDIDLDAARTFSELGGDSLSAVAFATSVEAIFDVDLPADSVLSPTGNPRTWAGEIERALDVNGSSRPNFANVHGKGATVIEAKDLTLDRFLDSQTLDLAKATGFKPGETRTVLLTGANGFLGHIVCLQWMEKLSAAGGRLICIIRGRDDEDARARLDRAFAGADPVLEERYHTLAKDHLEVLAGDVAEQYLGLEGDVFNRLAQTVDRISHVGALVNHRLAYEHLFGPNVVGTAEIIRLAVTGTKKTIDFVSTQAVLYYIDPGYGDDEAAPLFESIPLSDQYATGYAASKWAAEQLLARAHKELGVPVNTLRGGMMLAHQKYAGQINVADNFSRLLISLVLTGTAPYSFYHLAQDGTKASAHYEGAPVDVVAASVVAVADVQNQDLRNYNISNFHWDDGCSLDAFVDWIETAGYEVNRIEGYETWLQRFSEKLRNLPDEQRQVSALNVLGAWATPTPNEHHRASCENFRTLVPLLSTGNAIPHLDEKFIHKCLADLRCLDLI